MKVYISGPMTGIKDFNSAAFNRAAKSLRKAGHKAISPPEEDKKTFGKFLAVSNESKIWSDCLRRDLKDLLKCDSVHLLKNWERSRGATLEMMVAKELGMKFVDSKGRPMESPRAPHESILVEAERITNGPRRKTYGKPSENFARTALIWRAITGFDFTPQQVGLCMVGVKIARESHSHLRDNLVDGCGYLNTVSMIYDEEEVIEALKDRVS